MVGPLLEALREKEPALALQENPADPAVLASADMVLLLLNEGVLTGKSLELVIEAVQQDALRQEVKQLRTSMGRLVLVCRSAAEGWLFGDENAEVAAAPEEVQDALNDHEAITYRERSDEAGHRHEFPAMVTQLCRLLGRRRPTNAATEVEREE